MCIFAYSAIERAPKLLTDMALKYKCMVISGTWDDIKLLGLPFSTSNFVRNQMGMIWQ